MNPANASPQVVQQPSHRRRRLRHRRSRRKLLVVDGRPVPIEPGGMVDTAVRELGAVVVSVEELPD